ncbi:hypothetical protein ES703_03428 [subsurface metagenome]
MHPCQLDRTIDEKLSSVSVGSIHYTKLKKIVTLSTAESLDLPISASITENDKVIRRSEGLFVICQNGLAKIYPSYNETECVKIGNRRLRLRIKEIENKGEENAQKSLCEFHYRGGKTFGRRSKLIIKTEEDDTPAVIGYIELSIASLSNKARNIILNSPYDDGTVNWKEWDFSARGKYAKLIVSVSRIVIHPEFRGIGLSETLLKHAILFSKNYWQISGQKPIFLEITADMLKFVPFVQKVGMAYIGNTAGNVDRVKRDIAYMLKNKKGYIKHSHSAMIRMQSHYLKHFIETCKEKKISPSKLMYEISTLDKDSIRSKYPLIYGLLRFPKPTFMLGLNGYSDKFIRIRAHELEIKPIEKFRMAKSEPIDSPIMFNSVSLELDSSVTETKRTMAIQESFGIHREHTKNTVIRDFNLNIDSGDIVLFCGSSGSGKSSLLNILLGRVQPSSGVVIRPKNMRIGLLKKLDSKKPLIEVVGRTLEKSIYALNKSGLSEPKLYLRTFDNLSAGQKYRAMIASLITSKSNVWIADEFLMSLDNMSANIVAANVRKFVKEQGITLTVASSNPENYLSSLNPDKIVIKYTGNCHSIGKNR